MGEKASGQITFSNCETPYAQTISAGETVSSGGQNYILRSSVSVPGGSASQPFGPCTQPGQSGPVSVQAQNVGSDYNLSSGSSLSVAGHNSKLTATVSSSISGGSKKQLTVVSAEDVEKAKQKLADQNKDDAKKSLTGKFDKDKDVVIASSFKAQPGTPTVNPGIGQEASQATVTAETTYTLTALSKKDAKAVLHHYLNSKIKGQSDRRIYDEGENDLKFGQYSLGADGNATVNLITSGHIGPRINDKDLTKQLEGLNYGSIQQKVEGIDGVESVDTKFWPFWVSKAPSSDDITIKFVVSKNGND